MSISWLNVLHVLYWHLFFIQTLGIFTFTVENDTKLDNFNLFYYYFGLGPIAATTTIAGDHLKLWNIYIYQALI